MPAATRLPDRLEAEEAVLCRWTLLHLAAFHAAIVSSREHLRPWMPWIGLEPQTLEQRAALIEQWQSEWLAGGDVVLGVFVADEVAGGCGLHRRRGPATLEIGYWLRPSHEGRGLATMAARALTDAAFSVPGIEGVEIHHDKANRRSGAVPKRLGFEFTGERSDEVAAPGEVGIDCTWRMVRSAWRR